ncbi:hypothetical protein [Saccharothrix sp. ALI-22-I]|uniref:hypothetical protein n=1 Tax=Saccharothrix sp. ALI-22-I TaxID=1933778 RepID=UPI00117B434A|nr:hypothetical protein [Saccharothrix sp. ALI-22-I]
MQEPEPSVRAPLLGQDRLGAPGREHDTAFTEVYKPYKVRLVRSLCWQGAPLADADEVAQETLAQLYESWPSVRDKPAWPAKWPSQH